MVPDSEAAMTMKQGQATAPQAMLVPLVDDDKAGRIYDASLLRFALIGAFAGGVALGWLGYAIAAGVLPIAGLGQFAASGVGVGSFVGSGLGVALGGLGGAVIALYRLPPRRLAEKQ